MKIAIVSNVPALPPREGNRSRILALSRAIRSLGHIVYFVYLPGGISDEDIPAHRVEFGSERFVLLRWSRFGYVLHKVRRALQKAFMLCKIGVGLKDAFYYGVDEIFYNGMLIQLRDLQEMERFDAVCVEYVFNSKAFSAFTGDVLKLLDTHDSFVDRHLQIGAKRPLISYSPQEEGRGLRRANVVIAIQENEAEQFIKEIGDAPSSVSVVSHIVDMTYQISDYEPSAAAFVGSANGPNVVSMNRFIEHVLPKITGRMPAFRLIVAGGICNEIPNSASIVKLGHVGNLLDVYCRAPLLVNPIIVGTGVAIKLLEAMAAGVPSVCTETGARGLDAALRGGLVVVPDDDHDAFADATVKCATSQSLRQQLGGAAREAASQWNLRQMKSLERILQPMGETHHSELRRGKGDEGMKNNGDGLPDYGKTPVPPE